MKKNGFTLVELLAVIVILGIIITLAIPKVMKIVTDKKQTLYEDNISELERLAASYVTDNPGMLRNDSFLISIEALCIKDYIDCPIIDPRDNSEITGNIAVNKINNKYEYSYLSNFVTAEITINTGEEVNSLGIHNQDEIIALEVLEKENYEFAGWKVTQGNSIISGNTLIVGTQDTTVTARWIKIPELIVNPDGGVLLSNPQGMYSPKTFINLGIPTKENYEFAGWRVISGNSILSGNVLIMSQQDTIVKAQWIKIPELIVNLDNGILLSNPQGMYSPKSFINLGIPTKENYEFAGWRVISGNSILSGNDLMMGTQDTIVEAQWRSLFVEITYNCNGENGNNRNETHLFSSQLVGNWCSKSIKEGTNGMVYYFKGWSSNPEASEEEYSDMSNVSEIETNEDEITLYAVWGNLFDLNGNYEVIDDDNGDWRVKIKGSSEQTSGDALITINKTIALDVFLVGGGGGGAYGGGGGGYVETATEVYLNSNESYQISIGNGGTAGLTANAGNGESTTAFGLIADGGKGGAYSGGAGGAGGSGGGGGTSGSQTGGNGGTNGSNGANSAGNNPAGIGTDVSTREFYYNNGDLYSGGGGGWSTATKGLGGDGGGGAGTIAGTDNTGGGGGGKANGGSGIVVIRNARINKEFNYTGNIQRYIVPKAGTYKIELWGAQGGNYSTTYYGGYGGYSVGNINLNANDILYFVVGGAGKTSEGCGVTSSGGYNGGGNSGSASDTYQCNLRFFGSGGGATHVATKTGLLSTLSAEKDRVLMVAGGGGGAHFYGTTTDGATSHGGSGGGYIGGTGFQISSSHVCKAWECTEPGVATQSAAGSIGYFINKNSETIISNTIGSFGMGANFSGTSMSSGSGSGWYGGGVGGQIYANGGSGYIGNTNLINKSMYCYDCTENTDTGTYTINTLGTSNLRDTLNCPDGYNTNPISKCAKSGNGYAKITYIGE